MPTPVAIIWAACATAAGVTLAQMLAARLRARRPAPQRSEPWSVRLKQF